MYSISQLQSLSANVGRAISEYHNAVAENLRMIGKELNVKGDDPEEEGIDIDVEHDGTLHPWTVDRIKWSEEHNSVMVHATMMDYCEADYWSYLSDLGDATDYVLDAIEWLKGMNGEECVQTFPVITIDREDVSIFLGVEAGDITDSKMEELANYMQKWFLNDFSQAIRECAAQAGIEDKSNGE